MMSRVPKQDTYASSDAAAGSAIAHAAFGGGFCGVPSKAPAPDSVSPPSSSTGRPALFTAPQAIPHWNVGSITSCSSNSTNDTSVTPVVPFTSHNSSNSQLMAVGGSFGVDQRQSVTPPPLPPNCGAAADGRHSGVPVPATANGFTMPAGAAAPAAVAAPPLSAAAAAAALRRRIPQGALPDDGYCWLKYGEKRLARSGNSKI
ncbi:unnamed protein product, partial [Closterium sp. NIES-54]